MSKLMRLSIVGTLLFMGSSAAVAQEFYVRGGVGLHGESGKTEYNNADPNGLTNIQQSTDVTVNADGTGLKTLIPATKDSTYYRPKFSKNGKKIVYA